MRTHRVKQGECLSTIAAAYGFRSYRVIYDHPANASFKKMRPNPGVIHPGDELKIPDREPKKCEVPTDAVHRFRVKAPSKKVILRLRDEQGEPIRYAEYLLVVGDAYADGKTDGEGRLEHEVPVEATHAEVWVDERHIELALGHLDPLADTPDNGYSGARGRLHNLGLRGSGDGGMLTDHELVVFQLLHDLPPTGELDAATRKKLEEAHGS